MAIASNNKDVIKWFITYSDSYQMVAVFAAIARKDTLIVQLCVVFRFLNSALTGNATKSFPLSKCIGCIYM